MPKASKNKENGTSVLRSTWNSSCDSILVECLQKQKANGRMASNSSWHSAAWVEAEKELVGTEKTSGGGKKTASSCQYRWAAVCALCTLFLFVIQFYFLCSSKKSTFR